MGRLFVGNLSWSTGDEELRAHVREHGLDVTKVSVITDRETGRSRGFGFVDVEGDVKDAIEVLDGTDLGGRDLRVNEANERAPKSRPTVEHGRDREPRFDDAPPQSFSSDRPKKGKSRRRRGDDDKFDHNGWG